ncbi:hypothetical protein Tco_0003475 [Tanacetum coccineum]
MYYPLFTKAIIHHFLIQEKTLSWRNNIGMHTSKDDYLINSLRFVSVKESIQIYGAILLECLTIPAMKESKAYKTYLGYATGAVPSKIARKFKKPSPSNKDSDLVLVDEEPVTKGKRVKRSVKKSSTKPAAGVVIREAHVETKSKSKEKEKVDITHGKGIELLSKVALTEEAQMKEENESAEQESDSKQEVESEDDDQEEEEFVHTPTDDKDDDNLESKSDDVIKSDEEKGMDDTTYQFNDNVDARLKEPTQTDKEVIQGEGVDAEMNDTQQGNEKLETTQEQVVEDAHVTISTVTKKTQVPITSSSRSSDLASKFLKFSYIPHADVEIVSPLDVHVHHEVLRNQAPTLLTIPVSVITESSPVYTNIPQSSQTFTPSPILTTPNPPPTIETTNPVSTLPDFASVFRFNNRITALEKEVPITTRIKEQVKDQLPQILPKEVSNFALPVIEKLIKESRDEVTLEKVSSQPHSTYKAASTLTEFELKKILIDIMEKSESYLAALEHRDCYDNEDPSTGSDRGLKKRKTSKDAEPTTGPKNKDSTSSSSKATKSQPKPSGRKEDASRRDWFKKPTPPQEPTDPDWHEGKTPQKGPTQKWLMTLTSSTSTDKSLKDFDELMSTPIDFSGYILNECYKALSKKLDWENPEGGDYPFDLSKPLPLITRGKRQRVSFEYFINNDLKFLQGGVSTMTYMTFTTMTKAAQYNLPGIEDMVPNIWSLVKVAYDKYALPGISHWREQRKSFYAYARGRQSRGDVYSTKCMLAVTHVKINVTKPDTTRPDLRKRHPYTPYKDPQGFIYVDDFKRNRLMRSDELYKFSDGTLTRLLSSLEDITKNIDMEYLPKRRWSTLEKKRAHFMIKDINKLLKERRMMRSLEKFVGGRLYGTDLRLLQRTI